MQKTLLTIGLTLTGLLFLANLVVLNYTVFRVLPTRLTQTPTPLPTASPTLIVDDEIFVDTCGPNCQKIVESVFRQIDAKIATLAGKPVTSTPLPATRTPTPVTLSNRETFIPLGTGSTSKSDWEDIAGTDVYIDTANFPNIKTVYFETSMHIPSKNGVVSARLINVTDKHPVWYSDVSTDQDTSTFKASTITLDPGNKQYRIQMKTTLQYLSILDTARIKIISQ